MVEQRKVNIIKIFFIFLKVGLIGFGGGSALIPVVERELVSDKKLLTDQDYLKHTVIANITPGALPVKLGATCGYQLCGIGGAIAGAFGTATPGVVLTVALMALFTMLGERIISYFSFASVGITAFIIFLLFSYIFKTVNIGRLKTNLLLCSAAFLLTCGKELREIVGLLLNVDYKSLGTPLFDISTINLILISFFVILLLDKVKSNSELILVIAFSVVYSFFVGKTGLTLGLARYGYIFVILMIATTVAAYVFRGDGRGGKKKISVNRSVLILAVILVIFPVVAAALTQVVFQMPDGESVLNFTGLVGSSTVTSFGGGEAYVTVADGIFVQGNYIEPDIYYTRLIPIANSLPGPILVKVASGIGFYFGDQSAGLVGGLVIALVAASMAVGSCSSIAILVLNLYDNVKQWSFIINLKLYILPIICGMLISTSFAMLFESMKITGNNGISAFISLPAIALSVYGIHLLHKKFHLHDVVLLIIAAVVSLGLLLLF